MATSVYLIRHGAYEHRAAPEGTEAACDGGLSALGLQQVEALRARLERSREIAADALYCSTLPRARQTAAALAAVLGHTAQPVAELCEWDSGNELMGTPAFMAALAALHGDARRHHRFWPGFETIAEFTARVHGKLRELTAAHEGHRIVLVVHGGVVEAVFHHFLGLGASPFEGGYPAAGHTSITHWRRSDARGDWVQDFANDTHHLRELIG